MHARMKISIRMGSFWRDNGHLKFTYERYVADHKGTPVEKHQIVINIYLYDIHSVNDSHSTVPAERIRMTK